MECPIARSLERVGEWWSILILRDALHGLTRFDQFQKSLDIAPNMLTRRLNALVEGGLLERRRYNERPPRDEYVLTERGRDFEPVLYALLAWATSISQVRVRAWCSPTARPVRLPTPCWSTARAAGRWSHLTTRSFRDPPPASKSAAGSHLPPGTRPTPRDNRDRRLVKT